MFPFGKGGNVASEKRRQARESMKAYQVCSGVEGDGDGGSGKNGALRRIVTAYYLHGWGSSQERASEAEGSGRKNAFVTYRDMFIVRKGDNSGVPNEGYFLFPNIWIH